MRFTSDMPPSEHREIPHPASSTEEFGSILHRIRVHALTEPASGGLTLHELLEIFGPRGHVFLTVFFILPFLQPIPIPGLSTALGIAIAWVALFMFRNHPPWLPQKFANLRLSPTALTRVTGAFSAILKPLRNWIRPRGQALITQLWFRRLNGCLLALHALLLALPLPIPFSNFFPAITIFLIALGLLEEDLGTIAVGYVAAVMNFAFFVSLVLLPKMAWHWAA